MKIGKKCGDATYYHKSVYVLLPDDIALNICCIDTFTELYYGDMKFNANVIIVHKDYIALVECEDFDTTYEPVLGRRFVKYYKDNKIVFKPKPNKPRILHQRYKLVADSYTGFDQEDDKAREKWYRSFFTKEEMFRAGYLHIWKEMLDSINPYNIEKYK